MEKQFNICLDRKSFVFGNILPDYVPSFLLRPHFTKNNPLHIQRTIRLLTSDYCLRNQKRASRMMGVLCHFYCDSLCFAHNEEFTGGVAEHIKYEKRLHEYFMGNLKQTNALRFIIQPAQSVRASGIYRQYKRVHESYRLSRPTFANDILYSLMACIEAIVLIDQFSAEQVQQQEQTLAIV
jgi:hypothetical protein